MRLNTNIRWRVDSGSLWATVAVLCAVFIATSCHRRPLDEPDYRTSVRVAVNTDGIRNVTCDIYNDRIPVQKIEPEVMHVIFFDAATGKYVTEDFLQNVSTAADGRRVVSGEVYLGPGSYRMLAYDFGTEETKIRDYHDYAKACAFTDPAPSNVLTRFSTKGGEEPNILMEPEHLEVASRELEVIPYHDDPWTISADAHSVVESWYVQVRVDGIEWVNSAQAVLSGMAGASLIATDTKVNEPEASVWFTLKKSEDNGEAVVCAVFNTFGRIPNASGNLQITFDVSTVDKKTIRKTFDITDLFQTENALRHNWLLIDETIKVEPPKSSGGAFDPKIDDWDEEHRDIDI